jgi:hypothetical protein
MTRGEEPREPQRRESSEARKDLFAVQFRGASMVATIHRVALVVVLFGLKRLHVTCMYMDGMLFTERYFGVRTLILVVSWGQCLGQDPERAVDA